MCVAAAAESVAVAVSVGPVVVVVMILFGGFYINVNSIPIWLRLMSTSMSKLNLYNKSYGIGGFSIFPSCDGVLLGLWYDCIHA